MGQDALEGHMNFYILNVRRRCPPRGPFLGCRVCLCSLKNMNILFSLVRPLLFITFSSSRSRTVFWFRTYSDTERSIVFSAIE